MLVFRVQDLGITKLVFGSDGLDYKGLGSRSFRLLLYKLWCGVSKLWRGEGTDLAFHMFLFM